MFIWICAILCLNIVSGKDRNITYMLYTSDEPNTYDSMRSSDADNLLNWRRFNPKYPTVIYLMGYSSTVSDPGNVDLRKAYLEHTKCNFIAVDWERLANTWYSTATLNSWYIVSPNIVDMIEILIYFMGAKPSSIHIIGFSLGAHAAGITGRTLKVRGVTIGRITGLDPAGPGFNKHNSLSSQDASFVDIIHTDPFVFGTTDAHGHMDFYPNSDYYFYYYMMPGCYLEQVGCSHGRARGYYAESVRNPYGFPAVSIYKNCRAYMGLKAELTSCFPRHFTLDTNAYSPYAKN